MYGKKTDNISDSSTTRKPFARGENIENAIAELLAANAKLPESRCQKSISKTVAIMSSALGKAKYIQIDNLMCFQQKIFAIIYYSRLNWIEEATLGFLAIVQSLILVNVDARAA